MLDEGIKEASDPRSEPLRKKLEDSKSSSGKHDSCSLVKHIIGINFSDNEQYCIVAFSTGDFEFPKSITALDSFLHSAIGAIHLMLLPETDLLPGFAA